MIPQAFRSYIMAVVLAALAGAHVFTFFHPRDATEKWGSAIFVLAFGGIAVVSARRGTQGIGL